MARARGSSVETKWGRVSGSVHSYKVKSGLRWGYKINGPREMDPQGLVPYQEHRGGKDTQRDALKALNDRLQDIRNGNLNASGSMTLRELFTKFSLWMVDEYGPDKEGTVRRYEAALRRYVFPWYGEKTITEVTRFLRGHYQYLKERGSHSHGNRRGGICENPKKCKTGGPLKANTILIVDTALRSMYTYATKELQLFGVTPMASVRRPALAEKRDLETWSAGLIQRALKVLEHDEYFIAYVLVLLLGLRPGEVAGLRWDRIDWENRIVTINNQITSAPGIYKLEKRPKWESVRKIKMGDILYGILSDHEMEQELIGEARGWETEYVVCNPWTGDSLVGNFLSQRWARALKAAGLPHIPMHGGRHSFATALKEAGITYDRIGELLGHRFGSRATAIYVHATTEGSEAAISALDAAIKAA